MNDRTGPVREIMDTATEALARALPTTPTGWLTLAAACFALAAVAALLWTKVRRKWLARASRTLGGRFSGFMSAYYLRVFLPVASIAIVWAFLAYLWKLPGLIGGVLDLLDTGIDAARDGALTAHDDIRSLAYAFAALAGALTIFATIPFQLVKVWTNERQTRTAEENLTTDLINKAVEGLGAQKEINRLGRTVKYKDEQGLADSTFRWEGENLFDDLPITDISDWQNITLTVPNIEVRLGAIYALERIAQDSPRDHIRVMEILCAYLRENAPARDARRHDLGPWPEYPENPSEQELRERAEKLSERRTNLDLWIETLREHHAPRADIQAAITVIGRRSPAQIALEQAPKEDGTLTYRLDLRKVNLQAADLSRLNLAAAQLDASVLEGAVLDGAHLCGVVSNGARLDGASLVGAKLEQAALVGAGLEGVNCFKARMEGVCLINARMHGARLHGACLEQAHLSSARLEGADLHQARLRGANFFGARLEGANFSEADLDGAHMLGADLRKAWLSGATSFNAATLRGAGLKDVIIAIQTMENDALPRLLSEAFGDASVILPEVLKAGEPPLEHWSTDTLNWNDFETAWRAHQRAIGYVPPD